MKNIKNYEADKYKAKGLFRKSAYKKVEKGIYELKKGKKCVFVTSLSFEQETKYGEGESSSQISQYPLEDILDKFYCHVTDFYKDLNKKDSKVCYLEFGAETVEDIKNLRSIIGKHVYNKETTKGNKKIIELVIK